MIGLSELPKWSPWPARLLGLSPWTPPVRTTEKVQQEYDCEKYGDCLLRLVETGCDPDAIKEAELGQKNTETICVSMGDNLHEMTLGEARARHYNLLLDTMREEIEQCQTVVELGCGYGYNLWWLSRHFQGKQFIGGEYSANAVKMAGKLYEQGASVRVLPFNFYDADYKILNGLDGPIVVFTSHAIEQLPDSSCFFDAIVKHKERISAVFHFEPVYNLDGQSLLGLMRSRYAEVNDYNHDLMLQPQSYKVGTANIRLNVFGINPLNPTSVIQWEFMRDNHKVIEDKK